MSGYATYWDWARAQGQKHLRKQEAKEKTHAYRQAVAERESGGPFAPPWVQREAEKHGVDLDDVEGSGRGGHITESDLLETAREQRQEERAEELKREAEQFERLLEMWEDGDHQAVWDELNDGMKVEDLDGNPVFPKTWVPFEGSRGGVGWRNVETGEKRYQLEPPSGLERPEPGFDPELRQRTRQEAKRLRAQEKQEEQVPEYLEYSWVGYSC